MNSETSSVIGGSATYTTTYTATTAAGAAGVTITPVVSALTATNYSFSAANGNITITAVSLTVTATGPTKIYGTALTAGTSTANFSVTGTLIGSEALTSVTLTPNAAGLSTTTAANAAYVVTPSLATGTGGFLASNYNITYTDYNGTVAAKALTITANNQTNCVGTTFTFAGTEFTTSGLINGNTVTTATLTSTGSSSTATVGAYPIVATNAAGTGLANYTISYVNGTLTVNASPDVSNFSIGSVTNPAAGGTSTVTINSTSLGNGTYTVTYNLTGDNTATGSTASVTIAAGTGTFATSALATAGYTIVTITAIRNAAPCSSTISSGNTATIVIPNAASTTITTTGTWTAPVGVTSVTVEAWGGGGAGGGVTRTSGTVNGGGGAGGAYAKGNVTVVPNTIYTVTVGAQKTATATSTAATNVGNPSWFSTVSTVYAQGGPGGTPANNGTGAGGTGSSGSSIGALSLVAGGNGAAGNTGATGSTGGAGANGGGAGGTGLTGNANGNTGTAPGGGGSGGRTASSGTFNGGTGAAGQVKISYNQLTYKSQFISSSLGSTNWCAGETRDVTVTIKNIGTATWTDGTGGTPTINIGVKWNTNTTNWADYHVRTSANNLAPGETGTYTFTITASNNTGSAYTTALAAGTNNLTFDVVYEGISWFGNNGGGVGPGNAVSTSANQTILALPTVSFTAQPGATACINTDVIYTTQASQTNYVWSFPGVLNTDYSITSGGTTSSNTVTLKWLTSGSKTVTINYTNTNGCTAASATSSTATTISLVPTASAGGTQTICATGTATVSGASSSNGTIAWTDNGAGSITSGATTLTPVYTPAAGDAGTTVTLTMTVTNSPCTAATATYTVVVSASPTAPSSPVNGSRCGTGTVNISASVNAGETIDWYAASTGGTVLTGGTGVTAFTTPSISATTTYYAQTRNITTGCISATRTAVTATFNALPTVSFTAQAGATACSNTDVIYTTQATQTNYVWSFPGVLNTDYSITSGGTTSSNTVTLKWLTAGSKTVTVNYTNASGCTAATATSSTATTVTLQTTASVSIVASANPICPGASITFTATPVNGGTPSYQWKVNNVNAGTNSATFISSAIANNAVVSVVMTSNATCVTGSPATSNSITITHNAVPVISNQSGSSTYGTDNSYSVVATGASSFSATGLPTGITINTSTGVLTIAASTTPGTYNISVTASNSTGCSSTATVTITVNKLTITATGITVSDKQYNGNTTASASGGTLVGVVSPDVVSLVIQSAVFSDKNVGNGKSVTVTCTLSGANASKYILTAPTGFTANITPAPLTITARDSVKCYGNSLTLTGFTANLQSGDAITSVTLTSDGTDISADAGTFAIVPSSPSGTLFDANNYSITFVNGTLTVSDIPSFSADPSTTPQSVCLNAPASALSVTANSGSGTISSYKWYINASSSSFGGTLIPGATSATYTPATATAGVFYYYCVVTNSYGCSLPSYPSGAVTVNALPTTVTVTGGGTYCLSTTLNAANGSSGTIYYQGTTANGTSTATPSTSQFINAAGTYYFRAQSAEGCWGADGNATVVLQAPVANGVEICAGGTGSLTTSFSCTDINGSVGPSFPVTGATAGTGTGWTNPTRVVADDNSNATVAVTGGLSTTTATSATLSATNFGFSVPTNATIVGITATIGRYSTQNATNSWTKDNTVKLLKAGTVTGNNLGLTTTNWATTEAATAYGSASNLWGATWTPTDINNTNFGLSLIVNLSGAAFTTTTANVDYVKLAVTYTIPGSLNWYTVSSGGSSIGTGSSFNPVGVAGSGIANTNTAGTVAFYVECSTNPGCRGAGNFKINPNLPASVSIVSDDADNTICPGESVTFTATPTNGGTAPTYQWKKNTVNISGETSSTYTTTGLANGDAITVVMTSNATPCLTGSPATSNSIATTVRPVFAAGTISSTGETICYNGDPALIGSTTAASGGDASITYKWQVNGVDIASSNTATYDPPAGLTATTTYTRFAKDATCNTTFTQSSGSYVVTVRPNFTTGTISSTGETICYNGNPELIGSTTAASGGDASITYKWQANGVDIASSNAATYDPPTGLTATTTYTRFAKDATCNTTFTQSSGSYVVTVNSNLPASVTIDSDASGNTICAGTSVTFTATPTNGGTSPAYQWKKNTLDIAGETGSTYTTTGLANGDAITVVMTSNSTEACLISSPATSNNITTTVNVGTHNATTIIACDSYTWYGASYTSTDTYTHSYLNGNGCASVDTLHLTINASTHNAETRTECDSYTWHGVNRTSTGTYTYSYTNGDGCASVDTLHLTINASTHNATTLVECNTYTWSANGETYTASGTYTYSYTNANDCASVDTLHLTINAINNIDSTVIACGYALWYGDTLRVNGDYAKSFTNQNGCDSIITLHLTVNPLPTTPGSITGLTQVCTVIGVAEGTNYSIDPVADAVSYIWSVPPIGSTLQSGQGSTSINVTFDNSLASTNQVVKVVSVSDKGCLSASSYVVLFKTIPSTNPVTGPTNVCNYVGQAVEVTYSTTPVTYATSYTWAVPAGVTIVSGQGTTSINVKFLSTYVSAVLTSISVTANSNCGTRGPKVLSVSAVNVLFPSAINGPTSACSYITNQTLATYSIDPVLNAVNYVWTVPAGVTIIGSGQGSTSIQVSFNNNTFATSSIKVRAVSNCSISSDRSLVVYAGSYSAPLPITGPTNACGYINNEQLATYSIRKVANAPAYLWTVPAGVTVISHPGGTGENDTVINVIFNTSFVFGTSIAVQTTGCGLSGARTLAITGTLLAGAPLITGPQNVCEFMQSAAYPTGLIASYSIRKVTNANSYNWTAPANSSIISHPAGLGFNDTMVYVKFTSAFSSGSLSVSVTNACGTSPVRNLSIIKSGPAAPTVFDVQYTAPCPNRIYTYTEPAMPRAATQLIWSVPVGAIILSGQGTTSIRVSYPSSVSYGNVSVQSINNCMVGATRSLVIKMGACPNSITSTATSGKGELNPDDLTVKIYPNPTTSEFKMSIQSTANENVSIRVMDMQGRLVKHYSISASQAMNFGNDLKPGSYMVEIAQANKKTVQRVMKF